MTSVVFRYFVLIGFISFISNFLFSREMKLEITNRTRLAGIPSASGIEYFNDSLYIVGDNSAWVHILDKSLVSQSRYRIFDHPSEAGDTIPKAQKPDFEATTIAPWKGQQTLWIFGSGSKSPYRDILILFNLSNPQNVAVISLVSFYDALKKQGLEVVNIEGAFHFNDTLFLFNRADNTVLEIGLVSFVQMVEQQNSKVSFKKHVLTLPSTDGVQASVSGACLIPGTDKIIYTASMERTPNWVADGDILGSYIGVVDLDSLRQGKAGTLMAFTENEQMLPVKIESVTVRKVSARKVKLILVSDPDDGSSDLFEAIIHM